MEMPDYLLPISLKTRLGSFLVTCPHDANRVTSMTSMTRQGSCTMIQETTPSVFAPNLPLSLLTPAARQTVAPIKNPYRIPQTTNH